MFFYYDRLSGESGTSKFNTFLDSEIYLNDLHNSVSDVTNYQLIEIRKAIQKNSAGMQSAINESIANVCGSMEMGLNQINDELQNINRSLNLVNEGVNEINWRLNEINEAIAGLHTLINWKTDIIIEQQKIANDLLKAISKGVYLTERKKLNIDYTRKGNLFLQSALKDGRESPFYTTALQQFKNALMNDEDDYLAMQQLGFIYYTSKEHLDITNAERNFSNAAAYALVFSNDPSEAENLKNSAAFSLFLGSTCNYILNKLPKAVPQIRQAVALKPNKLNYKFLLAKYLAANGGESEAAKILEEVISQEKLYSIEVLKDQDLITKPAIQKMLDDNTKYIIDVVDAEILRIKKIAKNPVSQEIIRKLEHGYSPKTYINARITFDKLFY